ncbi:MAG: UDP-glucose 4-epimerase GalE [Proteobacteria bacterium]|jgi:UDP-glucose 4-epimerase|nr:UDP-glucose 4-epimerase GalE [Pseudomonadota bacterium]MBU4230055.1 UDP-glucose 4-epimerase GalE [Pseudomonadota bacterium]MDP2001461.1 UDP-glucose 4-epimerase GalE [Desulfurivibrionaceae bacterium]
MNTHNLLPARNVLVTGGAGYIGSHTSRQLVNAGCNVVVVDNFYSGNRWAVPAQAHLVEGDAGDFALMCQVIRRHRIEAVIHFAGHIVVSESVTDPLKYYGNNTSGSRNLIAACLQTGVQHFIFSSSAAVYGVPEDGPIRETTRVSPINPYGRSKLMTEWMLEDAANSSAAVSPNDAFRYVALRYFNVAGASLDGVLGEATPEATHLIHIACQAACGKREKVAIYGTDYPTPDGTCVRDYIHVEDLATAHLLALAHLLEGGASETLNCGYGYGFSVKEVLETVRRVSKVDFEIIAAGRRDGDPPALVANTDKIRTLLPWAPRHQDLETICATAFHWEKNYPHKN